MTKSDLPALVDARLLASGEPDPAVSAPDILEWLEADRPDLIREAALIGLEQLAYYHADPSAFGPHVRPGQGDG